MKKLTVLLPALLVLSILLLPARSATAQAELPPELAYLDAQIDLFVPALDAYQRDYMAAHGIYMQALVSHDAPPNGVTPPDNINDVPTDNPDMALADLWDYAGLPAALGWSLRVDTYNGPTGQGYVLTVETVIEGVTYSRAINTGPDTWRGHDWLAIVEGEI